MAQITRDTLVTVGFIQDKLRQAADRHDGWREDGFDDTDAKLCTAFRELADSLTQT